MKRPVLDNLDNLDALWRSGGAVLNRAGSASRAWVCPKGRVLAVLPDLRQAAEFTSDHKTLFPDEQALTLNELPLTSQAMNSQPLLLERGETIRRWLDDDGVLSASPGALMAACLMGQAEISICKNQDYSREQLVQWLDRSGYQRVDLVWSPGQYVLRGFIMDVFDPGHALPLRFEFFDETIERITSFHSSTQKSVAELDEISLHSLKGAKLASPVALIPEDTRILLCDPQRIEGQAISFHWLWNEICAESGALPIPTWNDTFAVLSHFPCLRLIDVADTADAELNLVGLQTFHETRGAVTAHASHVNHAIENKNNHSGARLYSELLTLACDGYAITVYTTNPRFLDLEKGPFSPNNLKTQAQVANTGAIGNTVNIEVKEGALTCGFVDRAARRVFVADRELSGISMTGAVSEWRAPIEWRDRLIPGQLVIHEDYGVGVFRGLEEIVNSSASSSAGYGLGLSSAPTSGALESKKTVLDTLVVEFADSQRLLVPVLQSWKLTALPEHESEDTQLDSLHGKRWKNNVEKDRKRAADEAKMLLEIFARRELERREPWDCSGTGDIYEDFIKAFPYTETADQLKAVNDIMADLSGPFPMDRLLVGDVGFGKTEVALRAAFRAVMSGHQVCILTPTTILAQQHYSTFRSRLAGFPVSVGILSRFVTRKETTETLKLAEEGRIDIVIGTHKLLQKGVKFKKLGLLVIDEEHRFGVMHKEGLKQTYGSVDILSMSATPIPRTLAMALRGLRSISLLSTPPEDRLPVTTFAGPWQTSLMRKAVTYELNRGGQIYFVVGRISRMQEYRKMLETFFPDAKVEIAHGQMPERELESIMMNFYCGKIDILLATTIIESGLDVGRANTIIVTDSQELGLAQMYQLRGRVGRRGENAFAWFFYPAEGNLPRETMDRLDAISSMTDLGSGYAIARRDLDIRGGGEIGGTSQHGMNRPGSFHMFYQMLERELARLRGLEMKMTELTFDQSGSIPVSYIPQDDVRVTLYRRLLNVAGLDELNALLSEMRDRFGTTPKEAKLLGALTAIRNFGGQFGLEKASVKQNATQLEGNLFGGNLPLGPHLKKYQNWRALGSHALGPGGVDGAWAIFQAMCDAHVQMRQKI